MSVRLSGNLSRPSTASTSASCCFSGMTPRVSLRNFADDVVGAGERLLAAARRLAGLAFDRAVAEMDVDAHLVAEAGAERGDRGIVHDLDLAREFDARRVVDAVGGELVDEHVAFEQAAWRRKTAG